VLLHADALLLPLAQETDVEERRVADRRLRPSGTGAGAGGTDEQKCSSGEPVLHDGSG
jgi:hypothetical protein